MITKDLRNMKAPDKICIRKDDTAPFGFTPHWIYTTKVQEQDIEYIRKDALLEWAKKERSFIEGLFIEGDSSFYDGQDDAYNNVISFIESL